ncbi:hypothetical protein BDN70DRAFT_922811 [Pholiota conissans]|uniref:Uncharacterized protein n=1 Tax=Pholiota conissans TaxID=109636 RepID=A0A9P5YWK6_9AGAR|nr:hypothetical protein BDN70DRAFT_922811 [Pholiota conissans]
MPSLPDPSAETYDSSNELGRPLAVALSQTWRNFDSHRWHLIPQVIDLRPDGTGTISTPYTVFTTYFGALVMSASQEIRWDVLAGSGTGGVSREAVFWTIPKLMRSTHAWSCKPWSGEGWISHAYVRVELTGKNTLEEGGPSTSLFNLKVDTSAADVCLPFELMEYIFQLSTEDDTAAKGLLSACKWSREVVMHRRRKERFSALINQLTNVGMWFGIWCGHFNPTGTPQPPKSFYGIVSNIYPWRRGIPNSADLDNDVEEKMVKTWAKGHTYYTCELPIPKKSEIMRWRMLRGGKDYEVHQEVAKRFPEFNPRLPSWASMWFDRTSLFALDEVNPAG